MHDAGYQRIVCLTVCLTEETTETRYRIGHDERKVVGARTAALPRRPRAYFQEWDGPRICGIRWVSAVIAIAGDGDCFAERAVAPDAGSGR